MHLHPHMSLLHELSFAVNGRGTYCLRAGCTGGNPKPGYLKGPARLQGPQGDTSTGMTSVIVTLDCRCLPLGGFSHFIDKEPGARAAGSLFYRLPGLRLCPTHVTVRASASMWTAGPKSLRFCRQMPGPPPGQSILMLVVTMMKGLR